MAVTSSHALDEVALFAMFRARRRGEYTETHPIIGLPEKYRHHLTTDQRSLLKSLKRMSEMEQYRTVNVMRQRMSTIPSGFFEVAIHHRATNTYDNDFQPEFYRTYRTFEEWGKLLNTEKKFPVFHTTVVKKADRTKTIPLVDFVMAFLNAPFVPDSKFVTGGKETLGAFTTRKMSEANAIFNERVLKKSAELDKALRTLDAQFRKDFSPRGRDAKKYEAVKKLREQLKAVPPPPVAERERLERAINDIKTTDPYLEFDREDLEAFGTLALFARRYDDLFPKFYVASGGVAYTATSAPVLPGGAGSVNPRDLAKSIKDDYDEIQKYVKEVIALRKEVDDEKAKILDSRRLRVWDFYTIVGGFFAKVPDEFIPCCERHHSASPPPTSKSPEPDEESGDESSESGSKSSEEEEKPETETEEEEEEEPTRFEEFLNMSTKWTGYYRNVDDNRVRFASLLYASKFTNVATGTSKEDLAKKEKTARLQKRLDALLAGTSGGPRPEGFSYDPDTEVLTPIVPLLIFEYVPTRVFPEFVTTLFIDELQRYADSNPTEPITQNTRVKAYQLDKKETAGVKRVHDLKEDAVEGGAKKTKLWTPVFVEDITLAGYDKVEHERLLARLRLGKMQMEGKEVTAPEASESSTTKKARETLSTVKTARQERMEKEKKSPQ